MGHRGNLDLAPEGFEGNAVGSVGLTPNPWRSQRVFSSRRLRRCWQRRPGPLLARGLAWLAKKFGFCLEELFSRWKKKPE